MVVPYTLDAGTKGPVMNWGSLIPTICANVSLLQSNPVVSDLVALELNKSPDGASQTGR
jgi:hypothetical protein